MIAALTALLVLQAPNTLTADERQAGWRLLFDGQTTKGWHNFKAEGVGSGWQVKDGALTIVDAEKAGDIVTDDKFEWFELTLDFNVGKGQNSGVIFHAADDGDAMWQSGPEVQIFDDGGERNAQKSGWLYELYRSEKDAAKPAGEWNHLRVLVTPQKCQTDLNGVKYYEYVLGSEDFKARVAKSKFRDMPNFAKVHKGTIGLQGDHGNVSFRNIKVRPIK